MKLWSWNNHCVSERRDNSQRTKQKANRERRRRRKNNQMWIIFTSTLFIFLKEGRFEDFSTFISSTLDHVVLVDLLVLLSHFMKISILKIHTARSIAFACWQWNRMDSCWIHNILAFPHTFYTESVAFGPYGKSRASNLVSILSDDFLFTLGARGGKEEQIIFRSFLFQLFQFS